VVVTDPALLEPLSEFLAVAPRNGPELTGVKGFGNHELISDVGQFEGFPPYQADHVNVIVIDGAI